MKRFGLVSWGLLSADEWTYPNCTTCCICTLAGSVLSQHQKLYTFHATAAATANIRVRVYSFETESETIENGIDGNISNTYIKGF